MTERAFGQLRRHLAVATRYSKRDFVWPGNRRRGLKSGSGSATRFHDLRDTLYSGQVQIITGGHFGGQYAASVGWSTLASATVR
jgi:hypothetical protein